MSYLNVLLLGEDTLKTYSNLNDNTFGKWILPAIKESQEMGLMPIIGECLYNKICELVADGSINDVLFTAYKDLLDDKIQPYLIYKTLSNIIPIINAKMANIGTVLTNDEHVINLTQGESDLLKTYYSERCDFYTKRLQDFIKNNQSAFPEIACGCGNMQPNLESSENSVGVWLGGSRGKKIGDNKCGCSSTEVTCADYQSGFTDGVEFQKRKLQITAFTENGRYISEDGFKEVSVDVAQTGHTDQELVDAYNSGNTDGVAEQKAKLSAITITENGNYNRIDGYSAVTVNVSSGNKINLTGDTYLTQYGRYYFDYDENTAIPSIKINFNVEIPSNYIKISLIDQTTSGSVGCIVYEGSGSGYTLDDLNLEYSYDGVSWNTWDYYGNSNIKLKENKHVYIRGYNPEHFSKNYTTYFRFVFNKDVSVCGNIMGLINYNNPPLEIPNVSCFINLFSGATKLVDVSNLSLPATTLTSRCYYYMFQGCTGITTAPALPATVLPQDCYNSMFRGCTNLNYVKCLATDLSHITPGTSSTPVSNWLTNVYPTGTFVKAANMNDWPTGDSGIPSGWTVIDNS